MGVTQKTDTKSKGRNDDNRNKRNRNRIHRARLLWLLRPNWPNGNDILHAKQDAGDGYAVAGGVRTYARRCRADYLGYVFGWCMTLLAISPAGQNE